MFLTINLLTESGINGLPFYLKTPFDVANFHLMVDCIIESVNKDMGYEAELADISYKVKNFEDRGLKLHFSGYEATLLEFAKLFLETMLKHSKHPFDQL